MVKVIGGLILIGFLGWMLILADWEVRAKIETGSGVSSESYCKDGLL